MKTGDTDASDTGAINRVDALDMGLINVTDVLDIIIT